MSVGPAELLELASKLRGMADEAAWRTSSGRAYYAGYHACLTVAAARGFVRSRGGGVHVALIEFLEGYTGRTPAETERVRYLGRQLRLGRELRTRADYRLMEAFDIGRATTSLQIGESILNQIAAL